VVAGLGVGRAVIEVTARIFASFASEGGPQLTFTASPTSLVNGFAAGFLIAWLTVALTSVRISRVNIIAAIRDLPSGTGRPLKRRWVLASTLVAAGFGAAAVVAVAGSQGVGTYLYPALAAAALCPLLVRVLPRRAVYTGVSLAVLGWGLVANTVRPELFDDGSTATFVVLGVVLTFSAVLLVSQNQELLLRLARPVLARPSAAGLSARLAVAYPVARRFRTGATLSMYGLVVFTLVLISVLGSVIDSGVDRAVAQASGGYALRVDYNPSAPIRHPAQQLAGGRFAGRVAGVAPLESADAEVLGVPARPRRSGDGCRGDPGTGQRGPVPAGRPAGPPRRRRPGHRRADSPTRAAWSSTVSGLQRQDGRDRLAAGDTLTVTTPAPAARSPGPSPASWPTRPRSRVPVSSAAARWSWPPAGSGSSSGPGRGRRRRWSRSPPASPTRLWPPTSRASSCPRAWSRPACATWSSRTSPPTGPSSSSSRGSWPWGWWSAWPAWAWS
jgi:putative ABC transport system permease protein